MLEIEPRALHALDEPSYHLSYAPSPFVFIYFLFETGS
jgi:hypothetical protein